MASRRRVAPVSYGRITVESHAAGLEEYATFVAGWPHAAAPDPRRCS
jgi:hypothetical protein